MGHGENSHQSVILEFGDYLNGMETECVILLLIHCQFSVNRALSIFGRLLNSQLGVNEK